MFIEINNKLISCVGLIFRLFKYIVKIQKIYTTSITISSKYLLHKSLNGFLVNYSWVLKNIFLAIELLKLGIFIQTILLLLNFQLL